VTGHLRARVRIALLLFVAILVQTALGSDMRVAGVAPDLMILITICAGIAGGPEAGAWVGFIAGLLADLFLTSTPIGLSALTYCLVGCGIGALWAGVLQDHKLFIPVVAFVGTVAAVFLFVALGDLLGQTQLLDAGRAWLIRVALVEGLWNAVLALPVSYLYSWMARGSVGSERVGAFSGSTMRSERASTS
jgi:rod shape-determining protein MreD